MKKRPNRGFEKKKRMSAGGGLMEERWRTQSNWGESEEGLREEMEKEGQRGGSRRGFLRNEKG
jgi:hypothetical protein